MIYRSPEKPSAGWVIEACREAEAAGHGSGATLSITEGQTLREREEGDRHSGADGKYCCLNMHHRTISTLGLLSLKYHYRASGQKY